MGIATVNQAGAIGAIGATIMAGYKLFEGKKNAIYPAALALVSVLSIYLLISMFDLNVKNLAVTQNYLPVALAVFATVSLSGAIGWSIWRAYKVENTLNEVMIETAKTTSMVFVILLGAAMLTAAFRGFGGEHYVKDFSKVSPVDFGHNLLLLWQSYFF